MLDELPEQSGELVGLLQVRRLFEVSVGIRPFRRVATRGGIGADVETGNIAAERQLDHDRVFAALAAIEAIERAAQPAGLNAHNGIDLRIEFRIASQRLDGNRVRLDVSAIAGQRPSDDELQEGFQLRSGAERRTARDTSQLFIDFIIVMGGRNRVGKKFWQTDHDIYFRKGHAST